MPGRSVRVYGRRSGRSGGKRLASDESTGQSGTGFLSSIFSGWGSKEKQEDKDDLSVEELYSRASFHKGGEEEDVNDSEAPRRKRRKRSAGREVASEGPKGKGVYRKGDVRSRVYRKGDVRSRVYRKRGTVYRKEGSVVYVYRPSGKVEMYKSKERYAPEHVYHRGDVIEADDDPEDDGLEGLLTPEDYWDAWEHSGDGDDEEEGKDKWDDDEEEGKDKWDDDDLSGEDEEDDDGLSEEDLEAMWQESTAPQEVEGEIIMPAHYTETIQLAETSYCSKVPPYVKIRENALRKAYAYAKAVKTVFKRSFECYGYVLVDPDTAIIEDVILAENTISGGHVWVNQDQVASAAELVPAGRVVGGWWHSHADFGAFHSGDDRENNMTMLDLTAAFQEVDGQDVKYSYSITVNDWGGCPDPMITARHECGAIVSKPRPILVLPGGPEYEVSVLEKEAVERLSVGHGFWQKMKDRKERKRKKWRDKPYIPTPEEIGEDDDVDDELPVDDEEDDVTVYLKTHDLNYKWFTDIVEEVNKGCTIMQAVRRCGLPDGAGFIDVLLGYNQYRYDRLRDEARQRELEREEKRRLKRVARGKKKEEKSRETFFRKRKERRCKKCKAREHEAHPDSNNGDNEKKSIWNMNLLDGWGRGG